MVKKKKTTKATETGRVKASEPEVTLHCPGCGTEYEIDGQEYCHACGEEMTTTPDEFFPYES